MVIGSHSMFTLGRCWRANCKITFHLSIGTSACLLHISFRVSRNLWNNSWWVPTLDDWATGSPTCKPWRVSSQRQSVSWCTIPNSIPWQATGRKGSNCTCVSSTTEESSGLSSAIVATSALTKTSTPLATWVFEVLENDVRILFLLCLAYDLEALCRSFSRARNVNSSDSKILVEAHSWGGMNGIPSGAPWTQDWQVCHQVWNDGWNPVARRMEPHKFLACSVCWLLRETYLAYAWSLRVCRSHCVCRKVALIKWG